MFGKWSPRARAVGICFALAAATLATYWPVRLHDFVNYDDPGYVTENPQVQGGWTWPNVVWAFRTGHGANWHPVTWLSHMMDCQLCGLDPGAHHLMNLAFHVANTVLLFLLLARMTGGCWRSAFVAALFALHPLHVESVAWAAERKDVLSTFFGLLSLWAYTHYGRKSVVSSQGSVVNSRRAAERGQWTTDYGLQTTDTASRFTFHVSRPYVLSLLFFALSLMSKPMLVTLPFLLLLLDYWPLKRMQNARIKHIRSLHPPSFIILEKLPFLALAALVSVVTLFVQEPAMGSYRHLSLAVRAANAVVSCVRYLAKAFWPQDLSVFYPHPGRWPAWVVAGSVLLLTAISALVLWQRQKRPYLSTGWFWFLGLLVPVLGLVQVGVQAMADRYTYLPLVGIFIILAWAGAECLKAFHMPARVGPAAAVLLLLLCALVTRSQLQVWLNTETLFTHAIAVTRGNWVGHYNLALLALRRYQDSQRGSLEKQVVSLQKEPPSQSGVPSFAPRDGNTGNALPGDHLAEVINHCKAALEVKPEFADPRITLAKALTEKGVLDEARAQLEWAIRLDPNSAEAHQNLGEILHRQGRVKEAIAEYRLALELRPGWEEVLNNLAWLLATNPSPDVRNGQEAVRLAERACLLSNHTNLWFLHTLAAAYAESGAFPQAVETADEARQLALASGQPALVAIAASRLEQYRSRRTYREP